MTQFNVQITFFVQEEGKQKMQPQLCASRKVNRFANVSHTALWGYGLALQQGVSNSPKFSFFKIISIQREVNLKEQSSISCASKFFKLLLFYFFLAIFHVHLLL